MCQAPDLVLHIHYLTAKLADEQFDTHTKGIQVDLSQVFAGVAFCLLFPLMTGFG